MASLKEIAYNIKSIANNGNPSDDDNLSLRQIYNWIHTHRAAILKEYSKNGMNIGEAYYQSVISPTTTSFLSVVEFRWEIGTELIYLNGTSSIKRVSIQTNGLQYQVPVIDRGSAKFFSSNKFTSSKGYAYVGKSFVVNIVNPSINAKNGLYVLPPEEATLGSPATLNIECVLSNPEEGSNSGSGVSAVFDYDAEYPFPQELVPLLVKTVVETELHISMSTQEDKVNDGDDATLMRSKRAK